MEAQKHKEDLCGSKGTCENMDGSYRCNCSEGYTNYGNERTSCSVLICMQGKCVFGCPHGFYPDHDGCVDVNECEDDPQQCGQKAKCFNTNGSYYCQCQPGFMNIRGSINFTALSGQCKDINECDHAGICGPTAYCFNLIGSYKCTCHSGYTNSNSSFKNCTDIDECMEAQKHKEDLCGSKGTCENMDGSYRCNCSEGYTNYGNERTPCSALDCAHFNTDAEQHTYGLQWVTKIGLTISLLCLILCILTFKFCRSIQGTRTTIHLHLCICLFMADLIFLAGISQTKPVGGCRFIAAMLHYFFLGVFTWMLLESVQLYCMVVLVFNATIRPLYVFLTGYGVPLVIVIISAISRPTGYGTEQHCWLSLKDGLIWSFFGPVCFIIILNIFFFIITVWKLAQKFSSLNPDLTKPNKIKAFTVTAIAQMCILRLMWVFVAFLFQEGTTVVAYIFTIFNSLQGALVFVMHCLLSKQVREEYAHFLSSSAHDRRRDTQT